MIGTVTARVPTWARLEINPNNVLLPIEAAKFGGAEDGAALIVVLILPGTTDRYGVFRLSCGRFRGLSGDLSAWKGRSTSPSGSITLYYWLIALKPVGAAGAPEVC